MSRRENRDVSVVIPTKNSERTLEGCLRSVIKQRPGEILAVDMLSTDGTIRILKRFGVRIQLNRGRSLAYSRQLGVECTKGAFVMFVDSDMELSPSCIARLRAELDENGWAGARATILSLENASFWQRAQDEAFSLFNRVGCVASIGTGGALFRKEVLLRHSFDTNFAEASEDKDICVRLGKNGYRLGVSSAVAYHRYRREFVAFVRQRFGYGLGDARLALKYRSIPTLVKPLRSALFYMIYGGLTKRPRLIPFWLIAGIAQFSGTVVGVSRIRGSSSQHR